MSNGEIRARPCRPRRFARACLLAAWVVPGIAAAQSISIGAGANWQMGDAMVDLDCAAVQVVGALDAQAAHLDGIGDIAIDGQLAASSASFEVGGNWSNQGSFSAGASTVQLGDRCGASTASISGSTQFSTLRIESARSKRYAFEAGQVQSISTALRLAGAPGAPLVLGSTQIGTQAGLALAEGGAQQITWIDVADMAAPAGSAWLAPGPAAAFDSIDSGNNLRWFVATPAAVAVPVPVGSRWTLMVLALAVLAIVRRSFRFR